MSRDDDAIYQDVCSWQNFSDVQNLPSNVGYQGYSSRDADIPLGRSVTQCHQAAPQFDGPGVLIRKRLRERQAEKRSLGFPRETR